MTARIREHLRGNVVAYVALFAALCGSAYAAARIGPKDIRRNAVRSRHIKNGQVKRPDVGAAAINGVKVGDGSLTGADVAGDSLGGAQVDEAKLFTSTRVVSPGATPAASGQKLQDALAAVPVGELWVLKLEPGVYEVPAPLHLRDNIKIEGSGTFSTEIISSAGGPTVLSAVGRATTMSDLVIGSGPGETALFAQSGGVLLDQVSVAANGSSGFVFGIHATGGSVLLQDSAVNAFGSGAGATVAAAQVEAGSTIRVVDSGLSASANGAGAVATALAVKDTANARASSFTASGQAGGQGFGVVASGSNALAQIDASTISGTTDAVGAAGTNKVQVGASKVIGGSNVAAPNVTCVFSYKEDYAPVNASTCN